MSVENGVRAGAKRHAEITLQQLELEYDRHSAVTYAEGLIEGISEYLVRARGRKTAYFRLQQQADSLCNGLLPTKGGK